MIRTPGQGLAELFDQQRQDRPGMLGAVDLAGSQIANQQTLAAEHIQWQETVVVVIAVEEPAFLLAMHRIVGGIEVEDQLLGRHLERCDEGLHQGLVDAPRPGPVGGVLETAQRRRAGQHPVTLRRRLQSEIMAKIRMVVDILVTQRQPEYSLAQHGRETMLHLARLPGVDQAPRRRGRQTQQPIRLAQKQNPAIARDVAAAKISHHPPLAAGWKLKAQRGTIRHRQILPFETIYPIES